MVDTGKVGLGPGPVVGYESSDGGVPIGLVLQGVAGAAPPRAQVRVTNLDAQLPTVVTTARSDGSFDITLDLSDGDELRFEAEIGGQRSEPADARLNLAAQNPLQPSPRHGCVRLEPGFRVTLATGAPASLSFANGCTAPVTVANPTYRLPAPAFELGSSLPIEVGSGERTELTFSADSTGAARENVVFLDVSLGSETFRYPITLFAAP